jgi:Fe-S-cluster containining protein
MPALSQKNNAYFRFECQPGCVNCCRLSKGFVFLDEDEAATIAAFLQLSESEFIKQYTMIAKDKLCLRDGPDEACIFLEAGRCRVYEVRPEQCRTYPFWPENIKSPARWKLTALECPGIGKGRAFEREEILRILKGQSLDSMR